MNAFTPSKVVQRIDAGSQRPRTRPGPGVVSLAVGEPDFDTPSQITDAAVAALRAGYTHYIDPAGDPELREALAAYVSSVAGAKYSADQIVVTHGGTAAIAASIMAIANPGDRIVIPDPNFSLYADAAYMAGAIPVPVPVLADYHLDLDLLEKELRGARMLVICSPCNPTGAVFTPEELKRVAEMIENSDTIVISDEAYCEIVYDGRPFMSMTQFPAIRGQVLYCQTFSKTFAMTGWRCGYLAGPAEIIKAVGFVNRTFNGAPNAAVCRAALKATEIGPSLAKPMLAEYIKRRDLIVEHARAIPGLDVRPPEGTFYLFTRYDADIPASEMTAKLMEGGIAVRSGTEFGPSGQHHIRFSFATSPEKIIEGLRRVRVVFEALARPAAV
ncbi:MAG: aminotransferase class I/II-fold pyridoxal phosphate-dependent enzyme [Vulcanimicrobiaceae bacterium]|jgi:aspartate aminotransferase